MGKVVLTGQCSLCSRGLPDFIRAETKVGTMVCSFLLLSPVTVSTGDPSPLPSGEPRGVLGVVTGCPPVRPVEQSDNVQPELSRGVLKRFSFFYS